jgi:RHS repeat-associated protein
MNHGNYGNGVLRTIAFNNRLQVSSISDAKGTTTLFSKGFGYSDSAGHNNGNISSITDILSSTHNETFSYDALNRLATGMQADNAFNITYSYDAWGNMQESGTSNFPPMGYDLTNRVKPSSSCTPNVVSFCYDAAGDMLADNHNNVYTYDALSRIKSLNGSAATYTYNALGNRVRKDATTGSTEYFYFGGLQIAELNPTTTSWTDYIFEGGKRIAKDSSTNASGVQFYHDDQIGSARVMTDGVGTKISDCTFNPFGEQIVCSPDNSSNHYRFAEKERDAESGLDYFGARYYSSSMGRLLQPDPLLNSGRRESPQTWNRYVYVHNNPVRVTDPSGLYEWAKDCDALDKACQGDRQKFRDALQKLKDAASNFGKGSAERQALDKIIEKIGTEHDGNHIRIGFDSKMSDPGKTGPELKFGFLPTGNTLMKFNFAAMDNPIKKAGYDDDTIALSNAGLVGHEGQHAVEGDAAAVKWLFSPAERFNWERRATNVESLVFEGANKYEPYGPLWNPSWASVDCSIPEIRRESAVDELTHRVYDKKKP